MNENEITKLEVGAWVNMQYGFSRHDFYVSRVIGDRVWFGKPSWCVSTTIDLTYTILNTDYHTPIFLGASRRRWWHRLLPIFNELICPFPKPGTGDSSAIGG